MNTLRVFLSCTLVLLYGCSEHRGQDLAKLGGNSQTYMAAQEVCAQQQAPCTYAYSPAWHNVFR